MPKASSDRKGPFAFCAAFAFACALTLTAASAEDARPVLDPARPADFLREASEPGKPFVVVAQYDLAKGMLAGYQAMSGRRIIFQTVWTDGGRIVAWATHIDPATGKPQSFYAPHKETDPETGKTTVRVYFAGVDAMAYLKDAKTGTRNANAEAIESFLDSDSGRAFIEAMPALYAAVEPLQTEAKMARLQSTFGMLVTGLQLVTGKFDRFEHADAVLGASRAEELRKACPSSRDCLYRGTWFTLHRSGFFNAMGGTSGRPP